MAFRDDVAGVARDPAIRRLALRRAGSRELAEDALQEAYWAVAHVNDPENIRDLRAYFCRALIREIGHLRRVATFVAVEDVASMVEQGSASFIGDRPDSVEDEVLWRVLAEAVLRRLDDDSLMASVPERSPDHRRYRTAIVAAAKAIFLLGLSGTLTSADRNTTLTSLYPQWFAQPEQPRDTIDQRLHRARQDVQLLLERVLTRRELGY